MSGSLVPAAAGPGRERALWTAALVPLALLPVAAAAALTTLVPSPRVVVLLAAVLGAVLAAVAVARRQGALGLWLAALLVSILAGEVAALPLGGQSGRLLWADAVLGGGLVVVLLRTRGRLAVPRAPHLDLLAVFIAWSALSLLVARDPLTALAELKEWVVVWAVGAAALAFARDRARASCSPSRAWPCSKWVRCARSRPTGSGRARWSTRSAGAWSSTGWPSTSSRATRCRGSDSTTSRWSPTG